MSLMIAAHKRTGFVVRPILEITSVHGHKHKHRQARTHTHTMNNARCAWIVSLASRDSLSMEDPVKGRASQNDSKLLRIRLF